MWVDPTNHRNMAGLEGAMKIHMVGIRQSTFFWHFNIFFTIFPFEWTLRGDDPRLGLCISHGWLAQSQTQLIEIIFASFVLRCDEFVLVVGKMSSCLIVVK